MAQLAIKGHLTKGKKVIEILRMLGGENIFNLKGIGEDHFYYIGQSGTIFGCFMPHNLMIFTLEEFLEKFPYKIGDKVLINDDENDVFTIKSMEWIRSVRQVAYKIEAVDGIMDDHAWFAHEMAFFNHKKEETMEEKIESFEILESHCSDEVKIEFDPSKFEMVKRDDGYYVVNKQPQYPKTYKESCGVLKIPNDERYIDIDVPLDYNKLLSTFTELIICRNAYWKIAGEQMGLGKPWEPIYTDDTIKYSITFHKNKLDFNGTIERNYVLIFPTKEIRNAFYENFKDLIEQCKELL